MLQTKLYSAILLFSSSFLTLGCTSIGVASEKYPTCLEQPEKQTQRSKELQDIVAADQQDRKPPIDWDIVSKRDEARAKRVAEVFAEGCFKSASDYSAAALVFQHGTVPDHYYQAYLWSKKAFELGAKEQSLMMSNAIDRYLMSLGQKQLFAGQSFRNGPNGCRCLGETELSFPDQRRIEFTGKSLAEKIQEIRDSNKSRPECSSVSFCPTNLKTPTKGLFPGIW